MLNDNDRAPLVLGNATYRDLAQVETALYSMLKGYDILIIAI